jgi:hypothetical protein
MADFNVLPTAEALGSLGSLLVIVFFAVALLVIWQALIALGAMVANRVRGHSTEDVGLDGSATPVP